ncbi:hypothetical protein [Streptomyces sp. YIM S03343]
MPEYTGGQYVTWDTWCGPTTVQITHADRFRIGYRSADDHREAAEATAFNTLAEATADWRPATPEEIAAFKARFRPAPENWD